MRDFRMGVPVSFSELSVNAKQDCYIGANLADQRGVCLGVKTHSACFPINTFQMID